VVSCATKGDDGARGGGKGGHQKKDGTLRARGPDIRNAGKKGSPYRVKGTFFPLQHRGDGKKKLSQQSREEEVSWSTGKNEGGR